MIIPDGYAQVNLDFLWSATGQHAEVAFGVALDNDTLTALEVAATVSSVYDDAELASVQVGTIELSNIHVKFGPNDTGAAADLNTSSAGTLTGNGVTPQVALLLHKLTLHGGRKGRGRMYWPGIQEGVVNDYGVLDSDAVDTFQGKFSDLVAGLISADFPMYLLHGDADTDPFAVTGLAVDNKVATQRRRLGR